MINSLARVSYGYTDKGNRYEKSSDGKKVGTILGAGVVAKELISMNKTESGKRIISQLKDFVKDGDHYLFYGKKMQKVVDVLNKSKSLRVALVGTAVTAGVALGIGVCRLIGHCYDKVVDQFTMRKADKAAEKAAAAE